MDVLVDLGQGRAVAAELTAISGLLGALQAHASRSRAHVGLHRQHTQSEHPQGLAVPVDGLTSQGAALLLSCGHNGSLIQIEQGDRGRASWTQVRARRSPRGRCKAVRLWSPSKHRLAHFLQQLECHR